MLSLVVIEWLFAILVLIVFTNRYIFGSLLRLSDRRTTAGFGQDPVVWPRVAIVVPVFNEGPQRAQDRRLLRRPRLSA